MTSDHNHQGEPNNSLLDDAEFVALMEAEFDSQDVPDDDLRKQRAWSGIESRLEETTKSTTNNNPQRIKVGAFAIAALLLIVLVPAVLLDQPEPPERIKGLPSPASVVLSAFEIDSTGNLLSSAGTHPVGRTIVFKVETEQTVSAALLLSRNDNAPEIRFTTDVAQDKPSNLLQENKKAYGYMIEPHDQRLRFCIATANDSVSLRRDLQHIESIWSKLPASSCIELMVSQ